MSGGAPEDVTLSDGCWMAVRGSRKLGGQVYPVRTGFPLLSHQLYTGAGAAAAGLSVKSSAGREACVF